MKKQTQKERILALLQENPAGINSFGIARDLALQLPTRIFELKRKGYEIVSTPKNDGSVDYTLQGQPAVEKKRVGFRFEGNIAIPVYE
jgi:hypothetical protein